MSEVIDLGWHFQLVENADGLVWRWVRWGKEGRYGERRALEISETRPEVAHV